MKLLLLLLGTWTWIKHARHVDFFRHAGHVDKKIKLVDFGVCRALIKKKWARHNMAHQIGGPCRAWPSLIIPCCWYCRFQYIWNYMYDYMNQLRFLTGWIYHPDDKPNNNKFESKNDKVYHQPRSVVAVAVTVAVADSLN